MPCPFPGMDPYLEGYLWPDVHNALASKIRQFLTPQLRPRYTARLEIYVIEDPQPEAEVGILYPDLEVLRSRSTLAANRDIPRTDSGTIAVITPAKLTLPLVQPIEVRIPSVEIRDVANNCLVACLEILSPVNKREPGLLKYRQKRQRLYRSGVHLLEIDLLRRGTRPFEHPQLPAAPYTITLSRAGSGQIDIWSLALLEPLPTVPVPLRDPDADIPLDLGLALQQVYEEAAYELSIDYTQPPPPPALSPEELRAIAPFVMQQSDF